MKRRKFTALPAPPAAWVEARARSTRAWQRLAPREQRMLTLAGVVVLAALLWLVAFEPAWKSVNTLQHRLPQLRAEAAQLDSILVEIRELQAGTTGGTLTTAEVPPALADSLRRAGLEANTSINQTSPESWEVSLHEAPVAPVLDWLQTLPFELRLNTPVVALARSEGPEGQVLAGRFSGHIVVNLPEGGA